MDFDHFLWRDLSAAERFYIKGLEAEKHGNYQISTYQEYARGFGLTSYSQLNIPVGKMHLSGHVGSNVLEDGKHHWNSLIAMHIL